MYELRINIPRYYDQNFALRCFIKFKNLKGSRLRVSCVTLSKIQNPKIRPSVQLKKVAVDIRPSDFELCNSKIARKFAASIIITNLV